MDKKQYINENFPILNNRIDDFYQICDCLYDFFIAEEDEKDKTVESCVTQLVFNIGSAVCSETDIQSHIDELKLFILVVSKTHHKLAYKYKAILKSYGFKIFES